MNASSNTGSRFDIRRLVLPSVRWIRSEQFLSFSILCLVFNPIATEPSNGKINLEVGSPKIAFLDEENEAIDAILKGLVLDALPHKYSDTKNWGGQSRVYDGFRFRMDDGRIETERVWKSVNDGTWKKYTAELIDPQKQFEVHLRELRQLPDGGMSFDLVFVAHLRLHARQSKWIRGVQLYSLSADGSANVQLALHCELTSKLDVSKLPPEILFQPVVKSAELDVLDFRIDRVSKVGGEIAQQVTEAVRSRLTEEIDSKEVDLVKKINMQLDKKKEKLRLKIVDFAKVPWASEATPLMSNEIRDALPNSVDKK
jgi:hypothetical protein